MMARPRDLTFILGGNFDDGKGNATAYVSYRKTDAIPQSQRDFSACNLSGGSSFSCGGSAPRQRVRFIARNFTKYTVGANGALIPFNSGPGLYNFAPTNYYQRSDDRYTGGLFSHYQFNEHATAYTEFSFMHDETVAQVAPSGAFLASGTGVDATGTPNGKWLVNCNNPLRRPSEVSWFCAGLRRRPLLASFSAGAMFEGGPRQDDLQHTSFA